MAQSKTNVRTKKRVTVANAKSQGKDYQPRTKLGRELSAIRERMAKSGTKFLTDAQIKREIAARRGGSFNK